MVGHLVGIGLAEDVLDGLVDGVDLVGILVGDLDGELLFRGRLVSIVFHVQSICYVMTVCVHVSRVERECVERQAEHAQGRK